MLKTSSRALAVLTVAVFSLSACLFAMTGWLRYSRLGGATGLELVAVIPSSQVDLGMIPAGMQVIRVTRLANRSPHRLNIWIGQTSCTCTEAELDKDSLLPGGEAELRMRVDTSERHGSFTASVVLMASTGPKGSPAASDVQQVPIDLSATINDTIGAAPTPIDFGEVLRGRPGVSRPFRLVLEGRPEDVSIESIRPPEDPAVQVSLGPTSTASDGMVIFKGTVSIDPNKLPSERADLGGAIDIGVRTRRETISYRIALRARLADEIQATPGSLYWSQVRGRQSTTLMLSAADGGDVEISRVETDLTDRLRWKISHNKTGRPRIDLEYDPGQGEPLRGGVLRGHVRIEVNFKGSVRPVDVPVVVL